MVYLIQGSNLDLTEEIRGYAEEKVGQLEKFIDGITKIEVTVGKHKYENTSKPYFTEVNVHIASRPVINMKKDAETSFKAIDKVKDHMKVELEKIKGKMNEIDREGLRHQKEYTDEDI